MFKHINVQIVFLQSGFVSDDIIKEAQNKIDKIIFIENNKKDHLNPFWDIHNEVNDWSI